MSNNFLHSSPSNGISEWADYNNYGQSNYSAQKNNPSASGQRVFNPQLASNSPSWTPIASKSLFNEALVSYGATPSSKLFAGLLANSASNETDHNNLNLTPMFNHNISLSHSNPTTGAYSGTTPFHDRSFHLVDFFQDSPIAHTPGKVETITPSRFSLNTEASSLKIPEQADKFSNVQKRSIGLVDTPPRQPHKLSITFSYPSENVTEDKASQDEDKEEEPEKDKKLSVRSKLQNSSEDERKNNLDVQLKTPCKSNTTSFKTKNVSDTAIDPQFKTPGRNIPDSSPSTVIVSSALKPSQVKNELDNNLDVLQYNATQAPQSPTPNKEWNKNQMYKENLPPAMGVFSERKTKTKATSKQKDPNAEYINTFDSNGKGKLGNKSHMQAGMNKFQIVFTDVHTLMNNKSKAKKNSSNNSKQPDFSTGLAFNDNKKTVNSKRGNTMNTNIAYSQGFSSSSQMTSTSQEANDSLHNVTKESSLISVHGQNSTFSSTNLNLTTDHSSFEACGLSSTPNGKFLLDKSFERPSPKAHLLGTVFVGGSSQSMDPQMPPPKLPQYNVAHPQPYQMMMSTPQHTNILNCSFGASGEDTSPSIKGQISALAYSTLPPNRSLNILSSEGKSTSEYQGTSGSTPDDNINFS